MPWFFRKDGDKKFCVYKGTKEDPGEKLKCHETAKEAQAHVGALMANVSDATAKKSVSTAIKEDSLDDAVEQVRVAFYNAFEAPAMAQPVHSPWPREVFSTHVIAEVDGVNYKVPYTRSGDEISFSPFGEWVKVEREWVESKGKIVSYKTADNHWRWMAVSSVAVLDKEDEIVSEKAYDDAIATAKKEGYGELDLVHIPGTDVGDCDLMIRLGNQLVEGGPWHDTPRAIKAREAVDLEPDFWGVSLAFLSDPDQFDGQTYKGGIRILKRTILPKEMAASHGTAIKNIGGIMKLDAKAQEALKKLGYKDEEIAVLVEKAEFVSGDPNVVEKSEDNDGKEQPGTVEAEAEVKANDAEEDTASNEGILQQFLDLFRSRDEDQSPPAATEKATEVDTQETSVPETEQVVKVDDAVMKAIAGMVGEGVVKAVNVALEPIGPVFKAMAERLEELEAKVDKVAQPIEEQVATKLSELPPVVKVNMKEVKAAETQTPVPPFTVPPDQKTFAQNLFAEIQKSVQGVLGDAESKYTT